jgi:hypothetical protein
MPFYRSFYATYDDASAAVATGVASIQATYLAAAAAALPTDANAIATGAPTTNIKVLSVSAAANGMVKARVLSQAPDGRQGITQMQVAATDVPPLPKLSGFFQLAASAGGAQPTVTFTGRLAKTVQFQIYVAPGGNLPIGTQLEDPFSGKAYLTTATASLTTAGLQTVAVGEASSSVAGNVTLGSKLTFTSPVSGLSTTATVQQLVGTSGVTTALLEDPATGAQYTVANFIIDGTVVGVTGAVTDTVPIVWVTSDNASSISVGKTLNVISTSPSTNAIAPTVTVAALNRTALPIGTALYWNGFPSYTFTTTESLTSDDTGSLTVPFIATFYGNPAGFGAGQNIIVSPSVNGFASIAPVTSIAQSQAYPQPLAPELVGEGLIWQGFAQLEPDGHYSANIYSAPLGS